MEKHTLKLVALFVRIDNMCKKKMAAMSRRCGRPSKLFLSEIITIYVWFMRSKVRKFKAFYEGIRGIFLRSFFPKSLLIRLFGSN
ncbi:MAG: hypothetical protein LBI69_04070 [Puniceicoccales bacterium]|jgi:hypothetical protein|nr:hypothetical protein [Puniceicoccales bacterium]